MTAQSDADADGQEPIPARTDAPQTDATRDSAAFVKDPHGADTEESEPPGAVSLHERPTAIDPVDPEALAQSLHLKRATLVSVQDRPTLAQGDDFEVPQEASRQSEDRYLGCVIDDRYLIEKAIARGGMGVVYQGRHQVIDKRVAIKVLKPDFADDDDVTARFLTEAKAASQIGNVRIIDVTDFGQLPDGATYLVMEFLDGQSLGRLIRSRELSSRSASPVQRLSRILHISRQIAEGLHAAHEAGIVHRDLKPDNIFLIEHNGEDDFVKILDFGIAKVASGQNNQTRAGKIFGTPHYMSPEQAGGEPIDRRTDIYALGVIMYEMASGRTPFDAENPLGILTQHLYVAVPALSHLEPNPDVAPALEGVILKALSKIPAERYQTMLELDDDLRRVERGEVPVAVDQLLERRDSTLPMASLRAARRGSRSARPPWGPILGVAGVVVLAAGAWTLRNRPRVAPEPSATVVASAPPPAPAPASDLVSVALVMSPIDAHAYSGNRDLGTMPINIKVPRGRIAVVEVRRAGYQSRRVRVDGTSPKVIVELKALPGTSVENVPTSGPPSASAKTYLLDPIDDGEADLLTGPLSEAQLEGNAGAGGDLDLEDLEEPQPHTIPDVDDEEFLDDLAEDLLDDLEQTPSPGTSPSASSQAGERSPPPAPGGSAPPAAAPAPTATGAAPQPAPRAAPTESAPPATAPSSKAPEKQSPKPTDSLPASPQSEARDPSDDATPPDEP